MHGAPLAGSGVHTCDMQLLRQPRVSPTRIAPVPGNMLPRRFARPTFQDEGRRCRGTWSPLLPASVLAGGALLAQRGRLAGRLRAQQAPETWQKKDEFRVPGLGMLKDLWRRHLRISAVLMVLMVVIWCCQGWGGLTQLQAYNSGMPDSRMLPISSALESWLFGVHQFVQHHGRRVALTLSPLELDFAMDIPLVAECGQIHRLLTACFLHNGFFHIVFNIGYLYTLAPLEAGAPGPFLLTFVLAGMAGNAAWMSMGGGQRALGASGGLCGLLGFELVSRLRMRQVRDFQRAAQAAFGLLVLGALLPGVGNWAHVGGLATGFAVALLTTRRSGYRSALVPWPLLLLVLVALPFGRQFLPALGRALALGVTSPGALGRGWLLGP
mmetsp:Transcript_148459/g.476818  ORF Transcript_148459/g.476818 Transcript_148459/m.476818 type:complete len:382 (-) Transcript_148459:101-1246(-)